MLQWVSVLPNKFSGVKIGLSELTPPLKILIDWSLASPKADMLIHTSFTEKIPGTKFYNYEEKFRDKPKVLQIWQYDAEGAKLKHFKNHTLYVSFIS